MTPQSAQTDTLRSPDFPGPRVSCFVARSGFGKTHRARERWFAWPRAVAIDVKHNDPETPPDYPGLEAWNPAELSDLLRRWGERERFRIVYRGQTAFPVDPARPDGAQTVEPIFRALAQLPDYLLTVDEAARFCRRTYTPGQPDDGLFAIVHQGRTKGQAVTLCAQRSSMLPIDLTAGVEEWLAWEPNEPADFEYLRGRGIEEEELRSLSGHDAVRVLTLPGRRTEKSVLRKAEALL